MSASQRPTVRVDQENTDQVSELCPPERSPRQAIENSASGSSEEEVRAPGKQTPAASTRAKPTLSTEEADESSRRSSAQSLALRALGQRVASRARGRDAEERATAPVKRPLSPPRPDTHGSPARGPEGRRGTQVAKGKAVTAGALESGGRGGEHEATPSSEVATRSSTPSFGDSGPMGARVHTQGAARAANGTRDADGQRATANAANASYRTGRASDGSSPHARLADSRAPDSEAAESPSPDTPSPNTRRWDGGGATPPRRGSITPISDGSPMSDPFDAPHPLAGQMGQGPPLADPASSADPRRGGFAASPSVDAPEPEGWGGRRRDSSPPTTSGFATMIDGASMADLVQLECLRGMTKAVRVEGPDAEGTLYFDQGQVVHAVAGNLTGQEAALHILGWAEGTVKPSEGVWSGQPTIGTGWQGLLMLAAQRADETQVDRAPVMARASAEARFSTDLDVAEFDALLAETPVTAPEVMEASGLTLDAVPESTEPSEPSERSERSARSRTKPVPEDVFVDAFRMAEEPSTIESETRTPVRTLSQKAQFQLSEREGEMPSIIRAVRLDADGEVIQSDGDVSEFADAAAYAVRLAQLIGEGLGLEGFRGFECTAQSKSMITYLDDDGSVVAIEASARADLSAHRKKAGL